VVTANAAGWLSVFAPPKVAPVALTVGDLRGLPDLSAYGHMNLATLEPRTVADGAQAAAATGLQQLRPALPADVPTHVTWEVVDRGTATFTFDAATADAAAARAGRASPNIPTGLNGTAVTVVAGPAMVAVYGATPGTSSAQQIEGSLPTLVIAEMARPTASTNGATLQQLEDFLLAQPEVSPRLAVEIGSTGNPAATPHMPGSATGLGSAVVWEKGGVVYAVGGLLAQSEVVDIARSLH
jgi:hypothetical protein